MVGTRLQELLDRSFLDRIMTRIEKENDGKSFMVCGFHLGNIKKDGTIKLFDIEAFAKNN